MSGWYVDKKDGQVAVVGPDGSHDAACGTFLDRLLLRGLSLHTVEAYAYDLVLVKRWLAAARVQLSEMNSGHIHEFLAWERGRDSKPKSINRRLHTLRLFFHHVTKGELPGATVLRRGIRLSHRDRELGLQRIRVSGTQQLRVRESRRIVEPLTVLQVNELLGCLRRYRDLAIAYLMLLCGFRSQEVLNLRVSDIDLEDRRLRVRGKGGKERAVPAPTLLLAVIAKYSQLERPASKAPQVFLVMQGAKKGQPMTRAGLRKVFRTRRKRSSLANANPHRLRHTFGTDMARSGVRLPILQRMMGHAYAETTLQYVNISMVDIAAEFQRAAAKLENRYEFDGGAR
ncbi:MAG: tyrosine-type recombinase/integrase [Myxococcales bacterium]|nr:tyrosine-type recombinase/integrase [Myxococcales bacterium]